MSHRTRIACLLLLLATLPAWGQDTTRQVLLLAVEGAIGPAVSDFIQRGIARAELEGAELVILRMDTPGGLDTAMRDINKRILAAGVPVATYVAPGGARAASAGTYIMYASHVAAMAPATNLGSATPVQMGPAPPPGREDSEEENGGASDDAEGEDEQDAKKKGRGKKERATGGDTAMERKVVNDAAAYIRGLARMRGRNAEWAEEAVREAANLTAEEALEAGVIDVVADSVPDLLRQLDGRVVTVLGEDRSLDTEDATVSEIVPDWRVRLLAVITNPNVAYVLMLLGIYGLFFELSNPGSVIPGVIGAICLLLAFYALQVLPVSYAGLALILLGIAFMVGEAFVPSFGALGIGGAIAFVIGSLILMETDLEAFQLSLPLVLTLAVTSVIFFVTVVAMAVRHRRQPVVSGQEHMVGSIGVAVEGFDSRGHIQVQGELWEARTSHPVAPGQRVRVNALEGLVLDVEPIAEEKR